MNSTQCWMCSKSFEYTGEKYQDVKCPNCGTQNSVYPEIKEERQSKQSNQTTESEWLNDPFDDLVDNPQNEEEEMALNYNDEKYQGKFIYMPRIGEEITIEIKELREVKSDNPKFNFSENVPVMINSEPAIDDEGEAITKKKDLGYHIEAELTNGKILSVTSIAAFINVFKKYEINDGDKVKIFHKDKGIWEVEKL